MKKNYLFILLFAFLFVGKSFATPPDEGMWLLHLLKILNEPDMKAKGLKLSAEDIYSVNKASLKDAVVQFGGGCTGEVVSKEGLLLTNHHCGYGQIQSHSSVENDYLTKGFWAMRKEDELPNPGLTVTFIVRIEDVTNKVLEGIAPQTSENDREVKIKARIAEIGKEATKDTQYGFVIRPFFYGSEYYMFITETFRDIRLVGAPPSSIGKFGGDTDNWMWPRHTGDFSVFRIYAGKDNKPADYSKENVPYKPKHHFPISLKGIQKGDFTMVIGFPGRTQEYVTSFAIKRVLEDSNPYKIKIRGERLAIMDKYMKQSNKVRIQYASKYFSISNAWKKWIGENRGLKKLNAIEKKKQQEEQFINWAAANPERKLKYSELVNNFAKSYQQLGKVSLAEDYFNEVVFGTEILDFAYDFSAYTNEQSEDNFKKIKKTVEGFFKDYHVAIDKEIFALCMKTYYKDIEKALHPAFFQKVENEFAGDFDKFADYVFENSMLTSPDKVNKLLENAQKDPAKTIREDIAFQMMREFVALYFSKIQTVSKMANQEIELNQRLYVQGLREMKKDKKFYPDANSTLRLSFGKVADYYPYDGAYYTHFTTLEGIIEKGNMQGIEDYAVPQKLIELYQKKDYGIYGKNGKMQVCFTASNHTTGGNSGSPILNANGHLIGLNFDRNWEGTMSDLMYDPDRVRNIGVDIRYVLFVMDKFAGAKQLVDEMTIVK